MGNEQSSNKTSQSRDNNNTQAIELALEKQRRIYEARCRQMLLEAHSTLCENQVASSSQTANVNTTNNQKKLYPTLGANIGNRQASTSKTKLHNTPNTSTLAENNGNFFYVHEHISPERFQPSAPPQPVELPIAPSVSVVPSVSVAPSVPVAPPVAVRPVSRKPPSSSQTANVNTTNNQNKLYPTLGANIGNRQASTSKTKLHNTPNTSTLAENNGNFFYVHEHISPERFQPSAPPQPVELPIAPSVSVVPSVSVAPSVPVAPPVAVRPVSRKPPRPQHIQNRETDDGTYCQTCGNKFGLTIYQCHNGHSSCCECKKAGLQCGVQNCKKAITDMRNRTVEAYMAELSIATVNPTTSAASLENRVKCRNAINGCGLNFRAKDMEDHLKECPFNEMACPLSSIFGRCSWRGIITHVASHFNDFHPEHCQANVDVEMRLLSVNNNSRIVHFVQMGGTYNFLFHVKVDISSQLIHMAAQLLGTNMSAAKWDYEINVYNKAEPKRKYEFSNICHSSNTSVDDIFESNQCAVLPISYALTFVNNGVMTYKFYLRRVENRTNIGKGKMGRGRGRR